MKPTTLQPTATLAELIALGDWSLIVATCHYDGSHARLLSNTELRVARCQADGFGDLGALWAIYERERSGAIPTSGGTLTADQVSLVEQVLVDGDWSHFRDSSEEGREQVARFIRTTLLAKLAKEEKREAAAACERCWNPQDAL